MQKNPIGIPNVIIGFGLGTFSSMIIVVIVDVIILKNIYSELSSSIVGSFYFELFAGLISILIANVILTPLMVCYLKFVRIPKIIQPPYAGLIPGAVFVLAGYVFLFFFSDYFKIMFSSLGLSLFSFIIATELINYFRKQTVPL